MRLLVTGASGSGTTTLGKAIAEQHGWSWLDTDEVYWLPSDPPFQRKRDVDQRRLLLRSRLAASTHIVVSGSLMGWDESAEDGFDRIVFLQAPAEVRVTRLREREQRALGRVDEAFIAWAAQYDEGALPGRNLQRHLAWLAARRCPILRLSSEQPVADLTAQVRQWLAAQSGLSSPKPPTQPSGGSVSSL